MDCRNECGACCIAPSIQQAFFGMPQGKPAGIRCVHLDLLMRCELMGDERRPTLCDDFMPERSVCGDNRDEALDLLTQLERQSLPDTGAIDGILS